MGSIEENKAVIRRFVEEVQNKKNWDVFDELNADDFVNHSSPPGLPNDREGGKLYLAGFMGAFPDCRFTIDDMIAEGATTRRVANLATVSPRGTGAAGSRCDALKGGFRTRRWLERWRPAETGRCRKRSRSSLVG